MKLKTKIILLCICIIFCFIAIKLIKTSIESFENNQLNNHPNIDLDIGNETCSYFYKFGLSILKKRDFVYQDYPSPRYYGEKSYKGIPFFQHFPMYIKYNFDSIFDYMKQNGLTYDNFCNYYGNEVWEMKDNKVYHFWIKMKPEIQKIMNESFKKSGIMNNSFKPVIHFRCADTPFIKQDGYHFQKYVFFDQALKSFPLYNHIFIMNCSSHNSGNKEKEACAIYAKNLSDHLESTGYKTDIICNSNIDDFSILFYAPGVISTGSSFSFMAGFFGYGKFISTEYSYGEKCSDCTYFTIGGFNLLHSKNIDYFDTKSVIQMLTN